MLTDKVQQLAIEKGPPGIGRNRGHQKVHGAVLVRCHSQKRVKPCTRAGLEMCQSLFIDPIRVQGCSRDGTLAAMAISSSSEAMGNNLCAKWTSG